MPEPTKIPRPFADSGDKNTIPESSGALGFASWQEGFPAITGTPFAQGGVAPKRADFNGIFNALSAATVWAQQGGVYEYDTDTDYEVGNLASSSGVVYICKVANGPSSSLHDPANSVSELFWGRVYPQYGTFKNVFFSQTSGNYTALETGLFRITLKGGGGGGSGARTDVYCSGAGGGEAATIVFYTTLVKNQVYPYVIGAGGAGGTSGDTNTATGGTDGGDSSFNGTYTAQGGVRAQRLNGGGFGGSGGVSVTAPTGSQYYRRPGLQGQSCIIGNGKWYTAHTIGGGQSSNTADRKYGLGGCGACGTLNSTSQTVAQEAQAGSDGFILIEYAG